MTELELFWLDESGQAMTEYGLVIALIAAGLMGALTAFKEARENMFVYIADKLTEAFGSGD